MENKLITIIGGTGFVGQAIANKFLRKGYDVQVLARNARNCKDMFPLSAGGGRLHLRNADITKPKSLHNRFDKSFAVINCVGILFEGYRQNFSTIHTQCPERIAKMAKDAGVERFIQISALGVHKSKGSRYASSKATGETAVLSAFKEATIISPSVIFGPNDNFINSFAKMANLSPIIPLIGGGETKLQPVYVGDVAEAVLRCIEDSSTKGKNFDIAGADIYSLRKIIEIILEIKRCKRRFISLPWAISNLIALFAELLPTPFITRDQIKLLQQNNIISNVNGLDELNIAPQSMKVILPTYLYSKAKDLSEVADKAAA